ncbi:MAG TPA: outer membrane beta-barrel protein [Puia sp.]|jgi:hypothetical protein
MKESNFYSDEFEQLIREKTEQYKMYPSEKVWKGVHSSLHTKRKWFIGSMSLLVTGILFLAGKELLAPSAHSGLLVKMPIAATGPSENSPSKTVYENIVRPPFSVLRSTAPSSETVSRNGDARETPAGNSSSGEQPYKGITVAITRPESSLPELSEILNIGGNLPAEAPALPGIAARQGIPASSLADATGAVAAAGTVTGATAIIGTAGTTTGTTTTTTTEKSSDITDNNVAVRSMLENLGARSAADSRGNRVSHNGLAMVKPGQEPIRKGGISGQEGETAPTSATMIAEAVDRQRVNWLQDYAVYTLTSPAKGPRTYLQLSLSPTVNYRTLSGGDFSPPKITLQNGPVAIMHPGDAKNYVDHSPALGFELGGSLLYRVTRNLSIKGGLQFNFSRYKINAYASNPQQATITLNSYYGYYLDSLTSVTNVGNFGGKTQETLNNDYYQLSAPIGFELRVLGNERLQFNVGATIQPTYLLNTNSYMLTSDYTNYTKEPSLFRRWNVNGGVEAFLTYKTSSGIRWQVGPEFRYQLLSTYNSSYPIHENLKGYGIKIGITKVIP